MRLVFLIGLACGFSLALLCVGLVIEARAESRAALERSWRRGAAMSLRSLGDAKRAAKACCTILEASAGELTVNELHVLAIRRKTALELLHALARDCHAIRERLKKDAEVTP